MNIFVTGGGGYVGSSLVPKLLEEGHKVTVYDLMIYGDNVLNSHQNLKVVKGDLRNLDLLKKSIPNHDALIHLACISNDPSFELNPDLGKSINLDSFEPLVKIAEDSGIKRFLNASSSSVYGVKDSDNVHEEMSLEPLTDYSKYKAQCEDILIKYNSNNFITSTIRPATVCGYSKRQRLDVVVNIFTNIAFHKKKITVFGGDQLRPNIHIEDMLCDYIIQIVRATRDARSFGIPVSRYIQFGASPRASLSMQAAAKAHAFLQGRNFVMPDDIKKVAPSILRHRILLTYEAEAENISSAFIIDNILQHIRTP